MDAPADHSEVSPGPAPRLEEGSEAPVPRPTATVSRLASDPSKATLSPRPPSLLVQLICYLGVLVMLMGAATSVFCWLAFLEMQKPHTIPVVFQVPEASPPAPAPPVGLWVPLIAPGATPETPSQRPNAAATILLQPQPIAAATCASYYLTAPKPRPESSKSGLTTVTKYIPDRGPEVLAYQLLARSFATTLGGLALWLFGWGLGRPASRLA